MAPGGSRISNTEQGTTIGPKNGKYVSLSNIIARALTPTKTYINVVSTLLPKIRDTILTLKRHTNNQFSPPIIRRDIAILKANLFK